jgi:hypothetical protein
MKNSVGASSGNDFNSNACWNLNLIHFSLLLLDVLAHIVETFVFLCFLS